MFTNKKISEGISQLTNISPVSQGVGAVTSAWVDVKNAQALMAIINTGVLGTAATVDAKIQQATAVAGTGAKDVTGKAITQIVKATGDNKQALINFRNQELDTNGGFHFVQLSITVGTAASLVSGGIMSGSRFEPASDFNNATVVQIV